VDFWAAVRRDAAVDSSRSVALGSLFECTVGLENGRKVGDSSSSASSDRPSLCDEKRGGRRRRRLWAGTSESDEDSDELDSAGSEGDKGLASIDGEVIAGRTVLRVEGRGFERGERDRRVGTTLAGRGLVGKK